MKKIITLLLLLFLFINQTFALKIEKDNYIYKEYVRNFNDDNIFTNTILIPEKKIFWDIKINKIINNISYISNSTKDTNEIKFTKDLRNPNMKNSLLETYLEQYSDFEEVLINKLWEYKYNKLIEDKIIYKAEVGFNDKSRWLYLQKKFFINSNEDNIININFSPYDEKFIWDFNLTWNLNNLWEEVITPKIFIYWSEFEPRYFSSLGWMEKYYKIVKNRLRNWEIIYRIIPFYKWKVHLKKWENEVNIWVLVSIWNLRFDNVEYPSITF